MRKTSSFNRIEFWINELVFDLALGQAGQVLLGGETFQHRRLDADEIARHVGRTDFQEGHVAVIVHGGNRASLIHVEVRVDPRLLRLTTNVGIEHGDLQNVVLARGSCGKPPCLPGPVRRQRSPALAVASVAHLDRRLVDVLAADRDGAGESGHAAAAFGLRRAGEPAPAAGRNSARARLSLGAVKMLRAGGRLDLFS